MVIKFHEEVRVMASTFSILFFQSVSGLLVKRKQACG